MDGSKKVGKWADKSQDKLYSCLSVRQKMNQRSTPRQPQYKAYPYWKVGIVFSLCPAVGGVMLALILIGQDMLVEKWMGFWSTVGGVYGISLLFALVAIFFNAVPAVALAALYLILRLRRVWWSYWFVAIAGGIGAFMWWMALETFDKQEPRYWNAILEDWHTLTFVFLFVLGAVSSLVAAFLILPKREFDDAAQGR